MYKTNLEYAHKSWKHKNIKINFGLKIAKIKLVYICSIFIPERDTGLSPNVL